MTFSLYTIASEQPFLQVLARAVLNGFPLEKSDTELSRWTILVPNRRSARALESVFLEESGKKALLLPRIKPIGDIDEDFLADSLPEEGVPDGISKTDHLHAILNLLMQWARDHSESELAEDVLESGGQAFALAQSLQQLVNQFETEDADAAALKGLYTLDLAGHRQNILDLLSVVTQDLPDLLKARELIGPAARRNLLIRLEAQRIAKRQHKGPIIAAGSTGTNPATRDLLKSIASDSMGAVVLPGLDREMDDEVWKAVTPEHPQFALRTMLEQWGFKRSQVKPLGDVAGPRTWLMREALRPADVADQWESALRGRKLDVVQALSGVQLVETKDRQQEADVVALRLRQHVEESKGPAALITPDRDLAIRVKAALRRWNLAIDDSAGEPLTHQGHASLLLLMLRTLEEKFSASSLLALLHHPDCHFGLRHESHIDRVRTLEIAAFRGMPETSALSALVPHMQARRASLANDPHAHALLKNLSEEQWQGAFALAAELDAVLTPLADRLDRTLADHVERLLRAMESLSPSAEAITAADQLFLDVMLSLGEGSSWHPVLPLAKAQHSILQALARETLRLPLRNDSPLAIYGLAEARLLDADLIILGGLVEGVWPDHPDTGPWLNRPMRDEIKLQQPEREIGVTAHDFAQAMGHRSVVVTWPKRLNGTPAVPSRWLLRLQAVMKTVGLDSETLQARDLVDLSERLDAAPTFNPVRRPQVTPPVAARPTQFSVTRVEKLVRDSYWVYAHEIMRLESIEDIGRDMDAALRGSLVHLALQNWTKSLSKVPQSDHLQLLLAKGREVFKPYMDAPEVAHFWWPRFQRMARDFVETDVSLRANTIAVHAEAGGKHSFMAGDVQHTLTARADRIDIERNGEVRIVDYKSGQLPTLKQVASGFSPQLTLEAALVRRNGFRDINATQVSELVYLGVGGGSKGVEVRALSKDVEQEAEKAFANLVSLLTEFRKPSTAYIPRHNPEMEDQPSDYDHLSRRSEWQLKGNGL